MTNRPRHIGWLDHLNQVIADADLTNVDDAPGRSIVVTGTPRSGTTLMLQALQAHLPATVVDHLVASFWTNPYIGVLLSEHLRSRTLDSSLDVSFRSVYGLTPNWYEPHEFSYFWRDALGWQSPHIEPESHELETTDYANLASLLGAASCAASNILATKGFPLLWCGEQFLQASPNSVIIVMRRKPDTLRASFAKGRGLDHEWFSLKPRGWEQQLGRPINEQLDFQVEALIEASDRLLSVQDPRVIAVNLEDLTLDRVGEVKRLRELIAALLPLPNSQTT